MPSNMSFCTKFSQIKRQIAHQARYSSSYVSNADIKPVLTNRNPRNLEKLRIAYKPNGYHLEKPGKSYWHKLELETTIRYVKASVRHFENGQVISASTQEWPIKKQLYRYNDISAYMNIGRVLAQRCQEFGITEIHADIVMDKEDGKIANFLKALQDNGVSLQEAEQYKKPKPWDQDRPEKPWEITV